MNPSFPWKFLLISCLVALLIVNLSTCDRPAIITYLPFDPVADARVLNYELNQLRENATAIANILTRRTLIQRQQIKQKYRKTFNRVLSNDLIKLTHRNGDEFYNLTLVLLEAENNRRVHGVSAAIASSGRNMQALTDVICCLNPTEMRELKEAYRMAYSRNMSTDLKNLFSRLGVELWHEGIDYYQEFGFMVNKLIEYKRKEYSGYTDNWYYPDDLGDTDASVKVSKKPILRLLYKLSFEELRGVLNHYRTNDGNDYIENIIKTGFEREFRNLLLKIVRFAENRINHYALILQTALAKENHYNPNIADVLTRVFVSRSEIDLFDIVDTYNSINKRSLKDDIKAAFFDNDFENILLDFINVTRNNK